MKTRLFSSTMVVHSILAGCVSLFALSGGPALAIDYYVSTCEHVAWDTGCEDNSVLSSCTSPGLFTGNPLCPDPGGDGTSEIFGYLMDGTGVEVAAGDTINLCAGACDGTGSGSVVQEAQIDTKTAGPITVRAYPGEDVTIDGGEGAGIGLGIRKHVQVGSGSHSNYTFTGYKVAHFRDFFFFLGTNADGWTISNMEMSYLGDLQTDIGIGDTATCGPAHQKTQYAVFFQDNGNNVNSFTFKDNLVHHICKFAMRCNNHPNATSIVYDNNEFYNMAAINNDFDCVNVTISNNTIWDVADAISVENRSQHVVVEDNLIECRGVYNVHGNGGQRNCRTAITVSDQGAGSIPGRIRDVTIRRNTIRGYEMSNEGMLYSGIRWDADCLDSAGCVNIDGVIENNFISFSVPYLNGPACCGRGAIDVRTNKGLTIRNNTIVRAMIGLQIDASVSGVVHDVRNNLVINSQSATGALMQNIHVFSNASNSIFTNNNLWNSQGSGTQVRYGGGITYNCSQLNSGNWGNGNFCLQPTLQDITSAPMDWNLHLHLSDTGATDRGTSTGAPSDDIDGDPRSGSIDIGADEAGADTQAPAAPTNLREGP